MKVTVFGSGYVGLVAAACFAQAGNDVICVDVDQNKIARLQQGEIPIYEPGLKEIVVATQQSGNLRFTTDAAMAVSHGECQFIAVGTPPDNEGKADLSFVLEVAKTIGDHIQNYTIIINKSTVPIGTADKVRAQVLQSLKNREVEIPFDVVSNPEFLKEGAAINDFCYPDRVVLGVESPVAQAALTKLYAPFSKEAQRLIIMDVRSAELTKYAANAMLATKISFMNEMANLAEQVGADIEQVRKGIGSDPRIGYHFTHPGCGYGGSCFGKDIQALKHTAQVYQCGYDVIQAVEKVNTQQKMRIVHKILKHFNNDLQGKTFALWGIAFKPETDDIRDAPSLTVIQALLHAGAKIQAYDPAAMHEAQKYFNNQHSGITFGSAPEEILEGAHALIVLTEWKIFKNPDFQKIKSLLIQPIIFDGRNCYDPAFLDQHGFTYYGIGRGEK